MASEWTTGKLMPGSAARDEACRRTSKISSDSARTDPGRRWAAEAFADGRPGFETGRDPDDLPGAISAYGLRPTAPITSGKPQPSYLSTPTRGADHQSTLNTTTNGRAANKIHEGGPYFFVFFAGPYFFWACFLHFTRFVLLLSFLQVFSALASF
jgi:hypothetical protein